MTFTLLKLNQRQIHILINLIKSDFKNRYLGNYLGGLWAIIQPLVMVAVYWFVFTKGFGMVSHSGTSFLLWLLAGMVPWFLINDAIINASSSILSQSFLVKKMVFDVQLLPLVKIGAATLVNAGFWGFLFLICLYNHLYPTLLWFQLFYYLFCIISITVVLSLFFSSIVPFASDVTHALSLFFQIFFWITPVTWDYHLLPADWLIIINLNPFAYIINGIRETLIDQIPFWHHFHQTGYFWAFTCLVYGLSSHTFKKLRPHFADVL